MVGITLALCAAGCGGGDDDTGDDGGGATAPVVTVQQYASAVAEARPDVDRAAARLSVCGVPLRDCVESTVQPMADATVHLTQRLKAAYDLGTPPAEIFDLYRRTVGAASSVLSAVQRMDGTPCSNLSTAGQCDERYIRTQVAGDRLTRVLRGWDPYL